jgi:hypothetical protein
MAQHFNIIDQLTQELLAPGDGVRVNKISLVNTHASLLCTIDLYIEKALTGKFYLMKTVKLPVGVTLIYDDIKFSNNSGEFGLYIKLTAASGTPAVDVIIN